MYFLFRQMQKFKENTRRAFHINIHFFYIQLFKPKEQIKNVRYIKKYKKSKEGG